MKSPYVGIRTTLKHKSFLMVKFKKMVSILSAIASTEFNRLLSSFLEHKSLYYPSPIFDCRVWNVPNQAEAANAFLWREFDATKNSISMAARAYYSHKQLHKKK